MTMTGPARARPLRTPPGPPRSATPGLLHKLASNRLALMNLAAARYGDAARVAIGPKTLYIFNHPDYAKHVLADNAANYHKGIGLVQAKRAIGDGLLTSDGPRWREQRRMIQPVFQAKRIAEQAPVIADEAAELVKRLRKHPAGQPINITEEMTGLTLGVLGRALLEDDLSVVRRDRALLRGGPGPGDVRDGHAVDDPDVGAAAETAAVPQGPGAPGGGGQGPGRQQVRRRAGQR